MSVDDFCFSCFDSTLTAALPSWHFYIDFDASGLPDLERVTHFLDLYIDQWRVFRDLAAPSRRVPRLTEEPLHIQTRALDFGSNCGL